MVASVGSAAGDDVNMATEANPASSLPMLDLVLVLPVYRNASALPELAARLTRTLDPTGLDYRLLFVDDASPDDSWRVLQQLVQDDRRIAAIRLASNQGQHRALLAGLAQLPAVWLAVMDADLQDAPEHLPALIVECARTGVTVFARRQGIYQQPARMLTSRLFKTLLGWLLHMPADVGTYFVTPRFVAERVISAGLPEPHMVVMARAFSPGWAGIEVPRQRRPHGSSSYSALGRWRAAWRALRCAHACRRVLSGKTPERGAVAAPVVARINC